MKGKRILLAVTGSIAAYKSAILIRLLVKTGNEVQVLMTHAAREFISPLTLGTLSRRPVYSDVIDEDQWNSHVELGLWADAMVIAPCTASTLSRCANGHADNMVVATYLSARCPVFVAPAMDLDMWKHPSTVANLTKVVEYGNIVIPVGTGELASGLSGEGRMAEPEEIYKTLERQLEGDQTFRNKRVLITAGPTNEPVDPVRYIGNRSTGTMGIAIANALGRRGADVELVLGPTHLEADPGVSVCRVSTAEEMYNAAVERFDRADITILAAAVADFRPSNPSTRKIKKDSAEQVIELEPTKDIAAELGKRKADHQVIVGFALETDNEEANAREKLRNKRFDMIVLNSLNDEGAGFGTTTNKVTFLFPGNSKEEYPLKPKQEVAEDIVRAIGNILK